VVSANFGVLNSVSEPATVLTAIAPFVQSGGWMIVSLHNPLYWKDCVRPGHWPILARQLVSGRISAPDSLFPVYHHPAGSLVRAAAPYFRLAWQGSVGVFISYTRHRLEGAGVIDRVRGRVEHHLWRRAPWNALGKLTLFGLQRTNAAVSAAA
jgi:hypothetical protein